MNTKALLVAFAVIAAGFGLSAVAPALAQNMTGGNMTGGNMTGGNMTMTMNRNMTSMGENMTQPLEDENMTAGG
jgi:hypothetical protein